jgi:uncharacterized protein YdeI (YjbR/CyaY-like superfamily)
VVAGTVDEYEAQASLWPAEIAAVRPILLDAGLDEAIKWGKPCYSHGGKNIVIVQEFKDFLALMFFKGALLSDPAGVLESQGENTRSALRLCLTSVDDVCRHAATIRDYVAEAIAIEASGVALPPAPDLDVPVELQRRLDADQALAAAFADLTPGRRREYALHIGAAKKKETRERRVDECSIRILAGKGLRDR